MLSWQSIYSGLALPALNPKNIGEERKMKKRLLALALCLVMVSSLLPITAAADDDPHPSFVGLEDRKTYCGAVTFSVSVEPGGTLSVKYYSYNPYTTVELIADNGIYTLPAGIGQVAVVAENWVILEDQSKYPFVTSLGVTVNDGHTWGAWTSNGAGTHSRSCKNGCGTTPQTASCADTSPADCKCDVAGESLHDWQFTKTDSTLTAVCNHSYCPTKEVRVTLKADSVTLPTSPFNAQVILNGITEEEIKKEFGYEISPIRYKFKAPGDSAFTEITPADGAREGTYQAAVTLSPIEVAARYARNDDGTTQGLVTEPDGSITLYTQYTAVNPETTAQTGDNRPIELMMASIVVFSALAAAAFVADSKRRSRQ